MKMTINIGNFFFDKCFQLWTSNETFYNIFLLCIFAKMRRHDIPPNYRIRDVFSMIEYFSTSGLDWNKRLSGFHQNLKFSLLWNFLKILTFQTDNFLENLAFPPKYFNHCWTWKGATVGITWSLPLVNSRHKIRPTSILSLSKYV
jgi:hypothetical protein